MPIEHFDTNIFTWCTFKLDFQTFCYAIKFWICSQKIYSIFFAFSKN